ncbi:Uma2 family endonuclease [Brevundimonas sp.]|uniref:Uma2 family endonuclease n=1 Tax=Brevundimonas sp. TaxID=1871086 RepID=UPI0027377EBB|nr:Uma2 family endonuclease [Brevundimonas sp.]MDP3801451.1 Uma2 family endonuclease [Brevundimonas sp.]
MTQSPPGMEEGLAAFRFDFDRFEQMFEQGILNQLGPRIELLDGRIVEMAPGSDDHSQTNADLVIRLGMRLLEAGLTDQFGVRTAGTLRIGDYNAPEPDVFVVRNFSGRKYAQASDAVLVVEVSISTRAKDLRIKSPLYARAGIPEFWMVEPEARLVRVLRNPQSDGSWGHESVVTEGVVTPLFPDQVRVDLAELF